MRLDLNLYIVFDAIYREGSVTRAANRLNLTQPAISHALNRLRTVLNDPLFFRRGHKIVPTPFARGIAENVRQALQILEATSQSLDSFDPAGSTQRFTVGVRDVLEAAVLPRLMRMLTDQAPAVAVTSAHVERTGLATRLASGAVDAVIDVLLEVPADVLMHPLAAERLCVVARPGHPALRTGLDLDAYLAAGHVVVSARRQGNAFEDVELSRLGLVRTVRLRCQHYFAAFQVVQETDLLLTMPERYASILNRHRTNAIAPIPFEAGAMDMFLYWHRSADADPANRWLRHLVLDALAA